MHNLWVFLILVLASRATSSVIFHIRVRYEVDPESDAECLGPGCGARSRYGHNESSKFMPFFFPRNGLFLSFLVGQRVVFFLCFPWLLFVMFLAAMQFDHSGCLHTWWGGNLEELQGKFSPFGMPC